MCRLIFLICEVKFKNIILAYELLHIVVRYLKINKDKTNLLVFENWYKLQYLEKNIC